MGETNSTQPLRSSSAADAPAGAGAAGWEGAHTTGSGRPVCSIACDGAEAESNEPEADPEIT